MVKKYQYDPDTNCILDGNERLAIENVKHLLTDVDIAGTRFSRVEELDYDGYFGFVIWNEPFASRILMPGSLLEYVRITEDTPRPFTNPPIQIGIREEVSWSLWPCIVEELQSTLKGLTYNPEVDRLLEVISDLKAEILDLNMTIDVNYS